MKKILTLLLLLSSNTVISQIITETKILTYKLPANFKFRVLEFRDRTQIKVVYDEKRKEYFICGEKVSPRRKLAADERILSNICDCTDKGLIMLGPSLSMKISTAEAESLIRNTDFRNVKLDGNSIYLNKGDDEEALIVEQNDFLMAYASNYTKSYTNYLEPTILVSSSVSGFSSITFDFSSSLLQISSYPILDKLSSRLRENNSLITITGYTSSEEKETVSEMKKLALDRANATKTYLINSGVVASRIMTKGLGEARPLASNDTEEGRLMNRRVELKIE